MPKISATSGPSDIHADQVAPVAEAAPVADADVEQALADAPAGQPDGADAASAPESVPESAPDVEPAAPAAPADAPGAVEPAPEAPDSPSPASSAPLTDELELPEPAPEAVGPDPQSDAQGSASENSNDVPFSVPADPSTGQSKSNV